MADVDTVSWIIDCVFRYSFVCTSAALEPAMRLFVWICISITLVGTVVFAQISDAGAVQVSVCVGTNQCNLFSLICSARERIQVNSLQYGIYGSRHQQCKNANCGENKSCCTYADGDCLQNFTESHKNLILDQCSGNSSCGPISAVFNTSNALTNCSGSTSQYIVINYTCIYGPSTTTPGSITTASNIVTSTSSLFTWRVSSSDKQTSPGITSASLNGTSTTTMKIGTSATTSSRILTPTASLSTSEVISLEKQPSTTLTSALFNDGEEHPQRLIIILVVVVAVLVLSAILVIAFILHRRQCKKSSQEDAPKNPLPDVLINHSNMNFGGSNQDYKAVESSNYDEMNDESIATYSRPLKKKKDGSTIAKDDKKTEGSCATDDYDRIVFEKKYAVKITNCDSVSAIEAKKLDDTYSHVPSQSKPASVGAANDYSHCQFIRNESKSNDHTNKIADSNKPLVADNYSHVDLNAVRTKRRPSNTIEEDSYNNIELDKTMNPSRNGHAVSVRTLPKSEDGFQTFAALQSFDVVSGGWPICDRNSGVSLQDLPLQDTKAVSLPDNYIEFKIGDIYDTPRCKDQQYNVVLKGNKEQLFNRIETGSKRKSGTEENHGVTEDCAVSSDYELEKPIDF